MCEPKFRTPGIARRSFESCSVIRRSSSTDVPGLVIQWMRNPRSLNSGNSDEPMNGSTAALITSNAPTAATARRGPRVTAASARA